MSDSDRAVSCRDILDGVVCVGSCSSSSKLVLLFPNPSEGSPFREIKVRTLSLSDSLKNIITGKFNFEKKVPTPTQNTHLSDFFVVAGAHRPGMLSYSKCYYMRSL